MTDRIWIKGRSAWHATTVADIDTALTAAGVACPERWIQTRGLPDKR